MMEWKDIASAPRDETWIIAWDGKRVQPVCWVEGYDDEYNGWAYGSPYWGGTLYEGVNQVNEQPTHWMPLPPPPAIGENDE